MQNLDFYTGRSIRPNTAQIDCVDPEYFTSHSKHMGFDEDRNRKKASRMLFLISALCIMSFTAGLIIGIKFAGNSQREIIDKQTFNAVSDIGAKVTNIIQRRSADTPTNLYPKQVYPYVIKLGNEYSQNQSKEIATALSQKGHTIILSRNRDKYRVYVGPYRNADEAENALQRIAAYKNNFSNNAKVIQRL